MFGTIEFIIINIVCSSIVWTIHVYKEKTKLHLKELKLKRPYYDKINKEDLFLIF
jgi:uncharacterized membrane protein